MGNPQAENMDGIRNFEEAKLTATVKHIKFSRLIYLMRDVVVRKSTHAQIRQQTKRGFLRSRFHGVDPTRQQTYMGIWSGKGTNLSQAE